MMQKWFDRLMAKIAFETLFIVTGDSKFTSEEFRAMITVLDILRKKMDDKA